MGPSAQLSYLGETAPVDLDDLDDELRRGQLPLTARLRHAPWTGDRFVPLAEIPELAEARDAPFARLAEQLRAGSRPWLSTLVTLLVAVVGGLQAFVLPVWGGLVGEVPELLAAPAIWLVQHGITGFAPLLLDGAWWSPWTSQLPHAGPQHLLPNLAVLGYCGYRVERALGAGGYAVVLAASVSLASLAVALLEPLPVMGSSLAGYGVLGAQLAIGFRFAGFLPPGRRGPYAFGNIAILAFLFIGGLGVENASHTGHAFGLVGGALAALAVRTESLSPVAELAGARRRNLLIALALGLAPGIVGPVLGRVTALSFGPSEELVLDEQGITLMVPSRLRDGLVAVPEPGASADPLARGGQRMVQPDFGFRVQGLPAWSPTPSGLQVVFAGRTRLASNSWRQDPYDAATLAARFGADTFEVLTSPPALGEGWTSIALRLEDGEGPARLVEHHKLDGIWLVRMGWLVRIDDQGDAGVREQVFSEMIASAVVSDPPELLDARQAWQDSPRSVRRELDYGVALYRAGRLERADERLEAVLARGPAREAEALEWRLEMWSRAPEAFPPDARAAWVPEAHGRYAAYADVTAYVLAWQRAHGLCEELGQTLARHVAAGGDRSRQDASCGVSAP